MKKSDSLSAQNRDLVMQEARRVLMEESRQIRVFAESLGPEMIEAVNLCHACRGRIVITGMGKSGLVAKKIASTLTSTGNTAIFLHAAEAVHGDMGILTQADLMIAISKSGETQEVLALLPYARRLGVEVIAITAEPESTLAKLATVVLNLGEFREACPLGLAPMTSTTLTLALGDALAACLIVLRGFREEDFAEIHPAGALGRQLTMIDDLLHRGEEVPQVPPNATLREAILEMTGKKMGATLITENGCLVGLMTDGDLRRTFQNHPKENIGDRPVLDFATRNPQTLDRDMLAERALKMMEDRKITLLVRVKDQESREVLGVVHIHDLLQAKVV